MENCFVYLSGPITAKHGFSVEENVAGAVKIYLALLELDIPAFCPHLSGAFPSAFEVDYTRWIEYDLVVIARCTDVLMLPRWETSRGALIEREHANGLGIPVHESVEALHAAISRRASA